ncbi:unnamed protein product [Heterobilharzia americana]|nr:unnamed protein product [Heterobilharzia americana]
MWRSIHVWWSCVFGPSVYRVPEIAITQSTEYNPNSLELASSSAIKMFHIVIGIIKWTVLFWSPWAFKSLKSSDNLFQLSKYVAVTFALYFSALLCRGTGRFCNRTYQQFIALFLESKKNTTETNLNKLTLYTFSSPWPVQFDVRKLPDGCVKAKKTCPRRIPDMPTIFSPLIWIIAHTIGVRMAYIGCTGILNSLTFNARLDARDRLRRQYDIRRVGFSTRDGEFVEAFYADRRGSNRISSESASVANGDSKGEVLILCCEGNGGYPEIGTPLVPLEQGYSVLGWNHPGFGESTGLPFPEKEQNAVEACFLFAVHRLNFQPEQIYLFGWSIGGYTASWIAMNFPDIAGLILDATFDNIDELSKRSAPSAFEPVLEAVVKDYLDLNNLSHVTNYDGPVLIIRRSDDEIISTGFPYLMTSENESILGLYLSLSAQEQRNLLNELNCIPEHYSKLVTSYLKDEALDRQSRSDSRPTLPVSVPTRGLFPSKLGKQITETDVKRNMLLYIVSQYYVESPGTHCTPLASEYLRPPWSPLANDALSESSETDLDNAVSD